MAYYPPMRQPSPDDGHFEGGRWIPDPPKPIESMTIELALDTSQFERKLAALAPGLSGIACAIDELLLDLKAAGEAVE